MNESREENKNPRFCRRCLLQEADPEAYQRDLVSVLARMDSETRTPPAEYERRLGVCRACDRLNAGTCEACGCYVELRAAVRRQKCPYRKW